MTSMRSLIVVALGLKAADVVTTLIILAAGGVEVNPIMHATLALGPVGLIAANAVGVTIPLVAIRFWPCAPGWSRIAGMGMLIVLLTWPVINNALVLGGM